MSLIWSPAHMATFAKVVDLNGFTAAARALKVPKAAVSRSIAELEAELGLRVLERTTRRIHLTAAGEQLYPHCRAILDAVEWTRTRAEELARPRSGPLRVLADSSYGRLLLGPLVPRFLERFGDATLDVDVGQIEDDPTAERWDVAVRLGRVAGEDWIVRELGAPPALLCATPAYLQKAGLPTQPEDLEKHELLTPASAAPTFLLRLSHGLRRSEVVLRPKLAVNDPSLLHSAVAAGLGIGLIPEFLCRQGLATHRLTQVLADWQLPELEPLCAVYPSRLAEDPRVRSLVDFLAANIVPALAG